MGFGGLFRGFVPAFDPGGVVAAVPWWLSGGISAANCLAAYTPKGAASLAASYDNNAAPGNGLPDGTYDAVPGVEPTWAAATGWTFNGTTQWLNSGVVAANGYSMIVRFAGGSGSTWREVCGSVGTLNSRFRLAAVYVLDTSKRGYNYGATNQVGGAAAASGVMALTPGQGYYNGAADHVAFSVTWSGVPTAIYMGTYNNNGTPSNAAWNGSIQALAIYNINIASYVAAIYAAMAAL